MMTSAKRIAEIRAQIDQGMSDEEIVAECRDQEYEAECESQEAARYEREAYGLDDDREGPTDDDDYDIRGRPMRPRVNDAGEPYWM